MTETNLQKTEEQSVEVVDLIPTNSLERSEIQSQVETARRYPRSLKAFKERAMSMATLDQDTAASCFYTLPRANKSITGPSIRLAELCLSAWGNLRFGKRVVGESEDRKSVVGEGFVHDLETNVRSTIQVTKRITDKHGKRYSDDMIAMTGNAAASIALRNSSFNIVPLALIKPIESAARKLAVGDIKSLSKRRQDSIDHFAKMGVTLDQVLARIQKQSLEDVTLEDLEVLLGLATSLRDSEISLEEAFPKTSKEPPKTLKEKIKERKEEMIQDSKSATPEEVNAIFPPEKKGQAASKERSQAVYTQVVEYLKAKKNKNPYGEAEKFLYNLSGVKLDQMTEEQLSEALGMLPK